MSKLPLLEQRIKGKIQQE